MNKIPLTIIITTILLSAGSLFYTGAGEVSKSIIIAIKQGDAKNLATHFNQSINLVIDNKSGVYNKQQAEILINDFFNNNELVMCKVEKEQNQDNSGFVICTIENSYAHRYSFFVMLRKLSDKTIITNIKIEEIK